MLMAATHRLDGWRQPISSVWGCSVTGAEVTVGQVAGWPCTNMNDHQGVGSAVVMCGLGLWWMLVSLCGGGVC
jgi:hypothetical protein